MLTERKYFLPCSVSASLSQTATPTPPANGPHFFSGRRGVDGAFFVFVDMRTCLSGKERWSQTPVPTFGTGSDIKPRTMTERKVEIAMNVWNMISTTRQPG